MSLLWPILTMQCQCHQGYKVHSGIWEIKSISPRKWQKLFKNWNFQVSLIFICPSNIKIAKDNEENMIHSYSTEVTSFILLFSEVTSVIRFERRNLGKKLEDANRHAFDLVFKKLILLCFAFVFKVSGYFYKQLLLQNDSMYMKWEKLMKLKLI